MQASKGSGDNRTGSRDNQIPCKGDNRFTGEEPPDKSGTDKEEFLTSARAIQKNDVVGSRGKSGFPGKKMIIKENVLGSS